MEWKVNPFTPISTWLSVEKDDPYKHVGDKYLKQMRIRSEKFQALIWSGLTEEDWLREKALWEADMDALHDQAKKELKRLFLRTVATQFGGFALLCFLIYLLWRMGV